MRTPERTQRRRLVGVLAVTALAVAACSEVDETTEPAASTGDTTPIPTAPPTTTDTPTTTAPAADAPTTTTATTEGTTSEPSATTLPPGPGVAVAGLRATTPFADYRWVPPLAGDAVYAGPATPTSLDDVLLTPSQASLRDPDRYDVGRLVELLEAQGFAVNGTGGYRFFHDGYKATAYESLEPIFVTTDSIYHSWHLVFDRVLRDTEQDRLLPILDELLTGAVDAARDQEVALAGTELADAAHRATAYYEAAAALLEIDVGPINELAAAEVAAVEAGTGMQTSPVTGLTECRAPESFVGCVDFSLFRPRGHYTRSPELERYFRAMSLLGQEGFALADGIGVVPGLLVARVVLDDPDLFGLWTDLYEPTAFLVGLADDIDPPQLAAAASRAAPGWLADPTVLADVDAASITEAVLADHPVAIDPERAALRLMGARFTLDSLILDQLAWPNVGREPPEERRVHVSALDVAAAFGSPFARDLQLATESVYDRYAEQLDAMTALVAARQPENWAGTVYDAWLAAIEPQFRTRGSQYPDFMRTDGWAAKSVQTGLASYTELKHDTVLYTKQGSAGEGEGPAGPDFVPRHWVEPDPVAFGRISAAASLLRDGFAERDLLTDETDDLLGTLIELADWLGGIAERELRGVVAGDAENERLRGIGSELEYLWIASSEIELNEWGVAVPDWDERAALVTDVFTTSFDYLQLGTGAINPIEVIVPLGDGRFELAEGYVFSYHEFWRSTSEPRLTDEEWRMWVGEGDTPPRPEWVRSFVVGTTGVRLGDVLAAYAADLDAAEPEHTHRVTCSMSESVRVAAGGVLTCQVQDVSPGTYQRFDDLHIVVLDDAGTTTSWRSAPDADVPPGGGDGLLCREYLTLPEVVDALADFGVSAPYDGSSLAYQWVTAYWFGQGRPERMDVDGNGLPCELLFDPSVVAGVWAGDR